MYEETIGDITGSLYVLAKIDEENHRLVTFKSKINYDNLSEAINTGGILLKNGYGYVITDEECLRSYKIQDKPLDLEWLVAVHQEWTMDLHPVPPRD